VTHWEHAKRIASLLFFSHVGILCLWFLVILGASNSAPDFNDFFHVVFMGSTLTIVSLGAFRYVNQRIISHPEVEDALIDEGVAKLQVRAIAIFVLGLAVVVTLPFTLAIFGFGAVELSTIKTAFGVVETALGTFVSIIGRSLFGIPEDRGE